MMKSLPFVVIGLLCSPSFVFAQGRTRFEDVVKSIEARFDPTTAKPGDVVKWKLTAEVEPGWHLYPTKQSDPESSYVMKLDFPTTPAMERVGDIVEPSGAKTMPDPDDAKRLPLQMFEGTVVWEQSFRVTPKATNGPLKFVVRATVLVCNDRTCLKPEKVDLSAEVMITGGATAAPVAPPPVKPVDDEGTADASAYQATMDNILQRLNKGVAARHSGLLPFLLSAMFWGGITLLTPCVFPMIPITVSFFLKQSEKNESSPVLLAFVYCSTIILVLGIASLTLLSFFQALAVNPVMNIFIGLLFVFLALSLFGMYDLTLPASLTRFTSSREGKGGVIGTIFMALTFTIVSFTCVAPFLGGFSGLSQGQYSQWELVLGALAFSATFASPFFFLALFPSLIRKVPKSGGWLHTIKIVMFFVEIAAALKFFRNAELILLREPVFLTYDLILGMWVVLSVLCGLFLLRVVRIGDSEYEESAIGAPRFLFGFAFLTLGLYLAPGLFAGNADGGNHRPRGSVFAWVDAFLLPDPMGSTAVATDLVWTGDLNRALTEAKADLQRTGQATKVFIDFTGETCSNCKLNERDIFTKQEVKDYFKKFKLVKLYTDKVPDTLYPEKIRSQLQGVARQRADAAVNARFQDVAFGTGQLPLYVILEPRLDGSINVVGQYVEGKINNVDKFVAFLRDGINGSGTVVAGIGG